MPDTLASWNVRMSKEGGKENQKESQNAALAPQLFKTPCIIS